MRSVLLLWLVVLVGCSFESNGQGDVGDLEFDGRRVETLAESNGQGNVGDLECVGPWPAAAPVPRADLLSPTIEERAAGAVGVATARLTSVSYDLPERARNNRIDLGRVNFEFTVLEHLKTGHRVSETVGAYMEVGYGCEYIENDDRDTEALTKLSADLEEFFGDKVLILFLPQYSGFRMWRARVSYHEKRYGEDDTLENRYGLWGWNDGSQWLLQAGGIGSDHNPQFVDPLDASYTVDLPENTISLLELRERVKGLIAEEEERGVECVGADYRYQWHVRSGEEDWYRGRLGADGTPIECIAACNRTNLILAGSAREAREHR